MTPSDIWNIWNIEGKVACGYLIVIGHCSSFKMCFSGCRLWRIIIVEIILACSIMFLFCFIVYFILFLLFSSPSRPTQNIRLRAKRMKIKKQEQEMGRGGGEESLGSA